MFYTPLEILINKRYPKCDVFPITLSKFLLDRENIINFFSYMLKTNIINKNELILNKEDCEYCKKSDIGICKNHMSLKKVLNCENVLYDTSSQLYFYRNEIFKYDKLNNKLIIVYCPNPETINGKMNKYKVLRNRKIIIKNKDLIFNYPKHIYEFSSIEFMTQVLKCYFNFDLSLILFPKGIESMDWALVPNII